MLRSLVFAAAALSATHAFAPPASRSAALAPAVATREAVVMMAVAKANIQRERALTLGRSVLSEGEGSFIYNPDEEDDDEDDDEYEDDEDDEEDDEDEDDEE